MKSSRSAPALRRNEAMNGGNGMTIRLARDRRIDLSRLVVIFLGSCAISKFSIGLAAFQEGLRVSAVELDGLVIIGNGVVPFSP